MRYLIPVLLVLFGLPAQAEEKVLRLYQDADLSNNMESSRAIQLGIETAFSEVDNKLQGYRVEFVYLNHRGNVVRSKRNYKKFIEDEKALAIYSGAHSPPIIKNLKYINDNNALTLVPWAAGGPVTRYAPGKNWVFRLSVDDTRAGSVIVNFAWDKKQCRQPHLLLEDTPWGDSNLKNMSAALARKGIKSHYVTRFSLNLQDQGARILLRDILKKSKDCIILVGGSVEGIKIARALIDINKEKEVKLISHWGITGGNFHEIIPAQMRKEIDLSFIQTCFAFTNPTQSDFAKNVFTRLKEVSKGQIKDVVDLTSATGFIHAYDLTRLLIAAVNQIKLTGDINTDRHAVRLALENLKRPVRGLVKTYNKPFSRFDRDKNPNGHEALHRENYCMGQYGDNDEIFIIGAK